jgi:hypothetical protein
MALASGCHPHSGTLKGGTVIIPLDTLFLLSKGGNNVSNNQQTNFTERILNLKQAIASADREAIETTIELAGLDKDVFMAIYEDMRNNVAQQGHTAFDARGCVRQVQDWDQGWDQDWDQGWDQDWDQGWDQG